MSESVSGQASEKKPLELSANVSVYMGFDWEFDQADTVVFGAPLTPPPPFAPEPGLAVTPSAGSPMGLKPTAPIRIGIWRTAV